MTIAYHRRRIDGQDHDSGAAACAHATGGVGVSGQVNVVAAATIKADGADGLDRGSACAVVKVLRGNLRRQPEIDRDRVALAGPDSLRPVRAAVHGKALLVVSGHDGIECGPVNPQGGEEVIYQNPAGRVTSGRTGPGHAVAPRTSACST